jgi:regulatory protein
MIINEERSEQQAYLKLAELCARGEHCQHELTEKMRKWHIEDTAQARIMERLIKEQYVDDERFARAFVNDKIKYSRWGRRKVEQALWQKHIDANIAQQVLDDIEDDTYIAILSPMLKQKRKSIIAKNDYERNMKLIKWALGRGFTMDIIRQCITVEDEDEFLD